MVLPSHRQNCIDRCQTVDPLIIFIKAYKAQFERNWLHCISNKHDKDASGRDRCIYSECVNGCINGYRPCHPHQKRVYDKLKTCAGMVTKAFDHKDVNKFKDFEALYDQVRKICGGQGFGQMCIYDTALRIAASHCYLDSNEDYSHLMPKRFVYLHRGALKGAQALWKIDTLLRIHKKSRILKPLNRRNTVYDDFPRVDCVRPIDFFCKELQELGAAALEDFLCVFHNILEGYYLRLAASLL